MRPIILSLLRLNPEPGLLQNALWNLLVLTIRYQTVGKRRTGQLEIACARIAHSITDGNGRRWSAIVDEIQKFAPSEQEFEQDFARYAEMSRDRAAIMLALSDHSAIEPTRLGGNELIQARIELLGRANAGAKPIITFSEAISSPAYVKLDRETLRRFLSRIGNWRIDDGAPMLSDEGQDWSPSTIERRQAQLSRRACETITFIAPHVDWR